VNFDENRRIPTGLAHAFGWQARDGYPDEDPDLVVQWPGGPTTYPLTPVRAPDIVTARGDGGTTITIQISAVQPGGALRGLISEGAGEAHLDCGAQLQMPVRVMELVSQTALSAGGQVAGIPVGTAVLRLAEPLPEFSPLTTGIEATGTITVADAATATDGLAFTIYGIDFEYLDRGGLGNLGAQIDIGGAPSNSVLAGRIASAINAVSGGLTATALTNVVTIVGQSNAEIVKPGTGNDAVIDVADLTGQDNASVCRLRWLSYTAELPSNDVGTEPTRGTPVRWFVEWSRRIGADLPAVPERDTGLLHLAVNPFRTGLTDAGLYQMVPAFAGTVPNRQSGWKAQRAAALAALITRLGTELTAHYVDDLPGPAFARAHALQTVLVILGGQLAVGFDRQDAIRQYSELLDAEIKLQLARIDWLDDGDGQIEEGETDVTASKPSSAASWTGQNETTPGRPRRARFYDPR